ALCPPAVLGGWLISRLRDGKGRGRWSSWPAKRDGAGGSRRPGRGRGRRKLARGKGRGRLKLAPGAKGRWPSRPRPWQAVAVAETAGDVRSGGRARGGRARAHGARRG